MHSKKFKKALQDLDTKKSTRKYAIIAPHKSLKAKPKPTKKFILPLSLENNGTTTGTTAIQGLCQAKCSRYTAQNDKNTSI